MKVCKICGKSFSNKGLGTHMWRAHGDGVGFSPISSSPDYVPWNKGLTKETSPSVKTQADSLKRKKSYLESLVNDDDKLCQRWRNKKINAEKEGIQCLLSYEEYCQLVYDAGLVSSQLGFTGEKYVLARYNDSGDYTIDNCRFIMQQQNSDEKTISSKARQNGKIQAAKMNAKWSQMTSVERSQLAKDRYKRALSTSNKLQARRAQAIANEQERRAKLDTRYTGSHNSQTGTFWITNGSENKKWSHCKGSIPEGYYKGRVV